MSNNQWHDRRYTHSVPIAQTNVSLSLLNWTAIFSFFHSLIASAMDCHQLSQRSSRNDARDAFSSPPSSFRTTRPSTPSTLAAPMTPSSSQWFWTAAHGSRSSDGWSSEWWSPCRTKPWELRWCGHIIVFDFQERRRLLLPYYGPQCTSTSWTPCETNSLPSPWLVYERGPSRKIPRSQFLAVARWWKHRDSPAWRRLLLSPCMVRACATLSSPLGWSARCGRDIWHRPNDLSMQTRCGPHLSVLWALILLAVVIVRVLTFYGLWHLFGRGGIVFCQSIHLVPHFKIHIRPSWTICGSFTMYALM